MVSDFERLRAIITRVKRSGRLTDSVVLVLAGKIDWAVTRGDITINEADRLDALLDPTYRSRYSETLELATSGDTEAEPDPDVLAGAII